MKVHKLYDLNASGTEVDLARKMADLISTSVIRDSKGRVYLLPSMICPSGDRKEIDLVVWFDFDIPVELTIKTASRESNKIISQNIFLKDALIILEIKNHNTYATIKIENQKLYCNYNDKGWFNVSEQSHGQKNSIVNFFKQKNGCSPFAVNLIWLHRADSKIIEQNHEIPNVIWGEPSLLHLVETICRNNLPIQTDEGLLYRSSRDERTSRLTTEYFDILRKNTALGIGRISRHKINELIKKNIDDFYKDFFNLIGQKLTIIRGNPGTGKTLHLIHLASKLYQKRDLKCLILTFNKALQQDIKRLLFHSGLSSMSGIEILTYDAFAYACLSELEKPINLDFDDWTLKLNDWINSDENPRNYFKTAQSYDCILIDEGQDWPDIKKNIIFKLFGHKYTIVAIGDNQYTETTTLQKWDDGIIRDEKQTYSLEVSHRNKVNIVDFLKCIGNEYDWELINNRKLTGGRVIITNQYTYEFHSELVTDLQANENSFYDMMFLGGTNDMLNHIENQLNYFGHKGFVANREVNKNKMFPINEFRIISYQACRGLEGWTVVCYEWDNFMDDILQRSGIQNINQAIESYKFVALTRAIDTLVITLRNPNSETSRKLIQFAQQNPGVCELRLT